MPFVMTTQVNVRKPEEWKKKIDTMVDRDIKNTLFALGLDKNKQVVNIDIVAHYMSPSIRETYIPLLLESRCNEIKRRCLCHLLHLYDLMVLQKQHHSENTHEALYTITVILPGQSGHYVADLGMSCAPYHNRWLQPIIVVD